MANARFLTISMTLIAGTLIALAQAQTPYANPEYGFVVTPPILWVQTAHPEALAVYVEPLDPQATAMRPVKETNAQFIARLSRAARQPLAGADTFRTNIALTATPTTASTIKEFARITRARSVRMTDYRIVGEIPCTLGGMAAIKRTIRIKTVTGISVQTCEVTCMRRGRLVTITLAAPYLRFNKYVSIFDKVLASFTWKSHI